VGRRSTHNELVFKFVKILPLVLCAFLAFPPFLLQSADRLYLCLKYPKTADLLSVSSEVIAEWFFCDAGVLHVTAKSF
jgi:hypothetical protein